MTQYFYNDERYEIDRWHSTSQLIREVTANRDALWDLATRLERRFGVQIMVSPDGQPHPIRTVVNIGTQGPYWTYLRFIDLASQLRGVSQSVVTEVAAHVSQGVRLRKTMLGLFPEMPKELLFPLNLREM